MTPRTRQGAAALHLLQALRRQWREGRAALDEADWRAWRRHVAYGAAGMPLLMVGLVAGARRLAAAGALDREPQFLVRLGAGAPLRFSSAVFLQTFGSDVVLVLIVVVTAGLAVRLHRPITAASLVLAPLVTDLTGRFGWLLWDRARPTVLHDGFASPGFHAFPSGHTSKTLALYGLLAILWLRASGSTAEKILVLIALGFIVVVVPLARMIMGVHWPSDVLGGALLGGAWLAILATGLRFERTRAA